MENTEIHAVCKDCAEQIKSEFEESEKFLQQEHERNVKDLNRDIVLTDMKFAAAKAIVDKYMLSTADTQANLVIQVVNIIDGV